MIPLATAAVIVPAAGSYAVRVHRAAPPLTARQVIAAAAALVPRAGAAASFATTDGGLPVSSGTVREQRGGGLARLAMTMTDGAVHRGSRSRSQNWPPTRRWTSCTSPVCCRRPRRAW